MTGLYFNLRFLKNMKRETEVATASILLESARNHQKAFLNINAKKRIEIQEIAMHAIDETSQKPRLENNGMGLSRMYAAMR